MGTGIGRPPAAPRRPVGVRALAADAGPVPPRVGLEVQRPELVHAEHRHRIARARFCFAVRDVIQLQDPVLLRFEVRVVGLFPSLHCLKRHALLAEQEAQAFMADVIDHTLCDEMLGQLGQRPRREPQPVINRPPQSDPADLAALSGAKTRRTAPGVLRIQRAEPVIVEVVQHLTHPILRRERQHRDLSHVHALRRPQHDLRPPPRHHRPRRTTHNPQQPIALITTDLPDTNTLSHTHTTPQPTPQHADAPPQTLPDTALACRRGELCDRFRAPVQWCSRCFG